MAQSVLRAARTLMRRRKFNAAIQRLESRSDVYEDDFEYNLLLGIAYLYMEDTGSAKSYFEQARRKRSMNTELQLGQAVLLLQRGDVARAVSYYTDVLENDPQNKVAKAALEFIRVSGGEIEPIRRLVDTRRIEKFYPPLGFNTDKVWAVAVPLVAAAVVAIFVLKVWPILTAPGGIWGAVAEVSDVEVRHYVLNDGEIRAARKKAKSSLAHKKYNEALAEANRLLQSNANEAVKDEAGELKRLCWPTEPMFETVGTSYEYADAVRDPLLYDGCYVVWSGRLMGKSIAGGVWTGVLVVSTNEASVGGGVQVQFDIVPKVDMEREVSVLGRVTVVGGKLALNKCKVFQSVKSKMETP